jgi:hypothetical protein
MGKQESLSMQTPVGKIAGNKQLTKSTESRNLSKKAPWLYENGLFH